MAVTIRGGPWFWASVALVVFLAARAPGTLAGVLNSIAHLLDLIAHGVANFLNDLLSHSS
jgi:hypothetical protein